MKNTEQQAQINEIEAVLRDHVGQEIAPNLTFNGFKSTFTVDGPRVQLFVTVPGLDGDDSHETFQDNNGVDETVDFLERVGLMKPEFLKVFTF